MVIIVYNTWYFAWEDQEVFVIYDIIVIYYVI